MIQFINGGKNIFHDFNNQLLNHQEELSWVLFMHKSSVEHIKSDKWCLVEYRDHSVYAPSQWKTALHCNAVSHWLGAHTEWSLEYKSAKCRIGLSHTVRVSNRHRMQTQGINTLRQRQNGRHFPDDIFKCIFLNENVWISLKISLKFAFEVWINNITALVQIIASCRPGNKPLSELMMISLLMLICLIQPQWVKTNEIHNPDLKTLLESSELWTNVPEAGIKGRDKYYNMTVWILAGNYISFTIAAGLIGLHMPGVKKSRV